MTDSMHTVRRDRPSGDLVPWVNVQGASIPAFACLKITGRTDTGRRVYEAEQPDGEGVLHFTNGPVPVAKDNRGSSLLWNQPRQVQMDDDVLLGDSIGPQDGSWKMGLNGTGFACFRAPVNGVGVAIQIGGGQAKCQRIWFTVETVDCDANSLEVSVWGWTEGCVFANVFGTDSYGFVTVHDVLCIMNALTEDEMLEAKGTATLGYIEEDGYCRRQWNLDSLCGEPSCE